MRGLNLGLESLQDNTIEVSFEELMFDIMEDEQQFHDEQTIFETIDKLEFIRNHVAEHGITVTIADMIGNQISYSSQEELIEKLDASIEGLISKITGETLDNAIKKFNKVVHAFDRLSEQLDSQLKHKWSLYEDNMSRTIKCVDFDASERQLTELNDNAIKILQDISKVKSVKDINPNNTNLLKAIDEYPKIIKMLNDNIRKLPHKDITANELKDYLKIMEFYVENYKKAIKFISVGKLFMLGASTTDVLNKAIDNAIPYHVRRLGDSPKDREEVKAVMDVADVKSINVKLNRYARAHIRIMVILVMQCYRFLAKATATFFSRDNKISKYFVEEANRNKSTYIP